MAANDERCALLPDLAKADHLAVAWMRVDFGHLDDGVVVEHFDLLRHPGRRNELLVLVKLNAAEESIPSCNAIGRLRVQFKNAYLTHAV